MAGVFYFPLLGTPTAEGNQLSFFIAGTSSPLDVWTDPDLAIPFAQPIIFNADGNPDGPIYVSPSPAYKVVYQDANGVAIPGYPVDFVSPSTIPNVQTTTITVLTNAQIKALPTATIELVPAPGAGLAVRVFAATVRSVTSAGAYTNFNATFSALQIGYTSGVLCTNDLYDSSGAGFTSLSDFLGVTGTRIWQAPGVNYMDYNVADGLDGYSYPQSDIENKAVQISIANNGSGNLTGGNAANSLTVTVYYAIESVA